ncbi:hypothetical protein [Streptomyces boninensis]|uniref:hypothetical protein n=1 Tax=Streptomyces boninensis TaxID=2039455 RepID=UPI003B224CEC
MSASSRSTHRRDRRPLLVPAGAAAALLTGLFFIPSATAGPDGGAARTAAAAANDKAEDGVRQAARHSSPGVSRAGLDTGSYLAGGATCLVVGSGMAVYVLRRNRSGQGAGDGLGGVGQSA